ncbi:MAG: beta-galactosidase [Oscillospiraceae bacterium]|nr:beta-galactosidase [Oscillospiraceae bacterium]
MNIEKRTMLLNRDWHLKRIDNEQLPDFSSLTDAKLQTGSGRDALFSIPGMPAQVHEILISHDVIENPNIRGDGTACMWVGESDWLYVTKFDYENYGDFQTLNFEGLDTYVDIYLNGDLIAQHDDAYLPLSVDVSGMLLEHNQLAIHFKSPRRMLDAVDLTEHEQARVAQGARSRAFGSTYHDYLGPKPYLMRVGVYGAITIVSAKQATIDNLHFKYTFSDSLNSATLDAEVLYTGNAEGCKVLFELLNPIGVCIDSGTVDIVAVPENPTVCRFEVKSPELWYPRTHGSQPLYLLKAILLSSTGDALDFDEKHVGFRKIEKVGDFEFLINNHPLKIWGSNLAPLDTLTNVYNKKRMTRLLDISEMSNHNCLRVWGENERLHDDFYDQCDRRGILVWQDFFTTYSMYPVRQRMFELLAAEAEYQVIRLRDHACILMWCGGNENLMMRDFDFPDEEFMGLEIFDEIFPKICAKLDPERFYHRTSPDLGSFSNDPLVGDTHGYTHVWYVPGSYYPVFLSENNRVSTPSLHALKRMMHPDDLWPDGYDGKQAKNSELPWPESWNKYNSNLGYLKLGDIQDYYDANDLESMLYRLGWAHGEYMRSGIERYRRGRQGLDSSEKRITQGHLLWKLNNSCNHIFFGVIDYFMEPYIAFYSVKRAYEPVLLSFEVENFIRLWLVNDTVEEVSGNVYVRLFDQQLNRVEKHFEVPFRVLPDQSSVLCDLNSFGQFKHNRILHAYAVTYDGRKLAESFAYTDIERRLRFPEDGKITMSLENDTLTLTCDKYMRSVELLGKNGDEEFGWIFEDNYFDMIPGQTKRVKVYTDHTDGVITAKGYYSANETCISYCDFPVQKESWFDNK